MATPLIEARGLVKRYPSGERTLTVIDGLDLAVAAGAGAGLSSAS